MCSHSWIAKTGNIKLINIHWNNVSFQLSSHKILLPDETPQSSVSESNESLRTIKMIFPAGKGCGSSTHLEPVSCLLQFCCCTGFDSDFVEPSVKQEMNIRTVDSQRFKYSTMAGRLIGYLFGHTSKTLNPKQGRN
jgi:hypothetical protein